MPSLSFLKLPHWRKKHNAMGRVVRNRYFRGIRWIWPGTQAKCTAARFSYPGI